MDINTNSNISSLVASSISKLNLNTAARAFENSKKTPKKEETERIEPLQEEAISVAEEDKTVKSNINVEEIQKYAGMVGENVTVEEINYGLRYGRSVIADFSA